MSDCGDTYILLGFCAILKAIIIILCKLYGLPLIFQIAKISGFQIDGITRKSYICSTYIKYQLK